MRRKALIIRQLYIVGNSYCYHLWLRV